MIMSLGLSRMQGIPRQLDEGNYYNSIEYTISMSSRYLNMMDENSKEMSEAVYVTLFNTSNIIAPQNSGHLCQDPNAAVIVIGLTWFELCMPIRKTQWWDFKAYQYGMGRPVAPILTAKAQCLSCNSR